jgi:hypothetical protein
MSLHCHTQPASHTWLQNLACVCLAVDSEQEGGDQRREQHFQSRLQGGNRAGRPQSGAERSSVTIVCILGNTRKLLHDFEQVTSPLGASMFSPGKRQEWRPVNCAFPSWHFRSPGPFSQGAQWPLASAHFPPPGPPASLAPAGSAGLLVSAQKEVAEEGLPGQGGRGRLVGVCLATPHLQRDLCCMTLPLPNCPAGPHPRTQSPSSPGTSCTGQPQMAPWPWDKGHTVPGPGLASDWVTLSFCP